jgi:hypothetical protein
LSIKIIYAKLKKHNNRNGYQLISSLWNQVNFNGRFGFSLWYIKKTVYTIFENKEQLVNEVVELLFSPLNTYLFEQEFNILDARTEIKKMFDLIEDIEHFLTPKLFYDLKKYHSGSFNIIIEFLNNRLALFIKKNIQKGVQEDIYYSLLDE